MLKKFKKMKGFIGLLMLGLSFLGAMGHAELLITPSNDKWATDGEVRSIVQLGSRIYLGGTFTHVGPVTGGGVPLDSITGAKGADFPQVKGKINGVVADGKGGWFIGGSFTHVNNVTQSNLAHILSNGTLDSQWHPYANDTVSALVVSEDTVFVAGRFTSVNGTARNCLAAINAVSGALDTRWVPPPPNAFSEVNSLVVYGGKVYLGGTFTSMGVTTRHRLAALDAGNGALDPLWNPNADNDVHTLAVSGSRIYVGGMFTSMSGTTRHYLAAVDAVSGVLDDQWNPDADYEVNALAVSGSRIYVGGFFTSMGGVKRTYLAAVDAVSGVVDSQWTPPPSSLYVKTLAVNGGTVYVGGGFIPVEKNRGPCLMAVDAVSGALDTRWNPPLSNGGVNSLAANGNMVFVGGVFTMMGGTAKNYLAAIDAVSGDLDSLWNPSANSDVCALAVKGNKIYIGGRFTSMSGATRNHLAAVDAVSGDLDPQWNPDAKGDVFVLVASGSRIYAGGAFSVIGGTPRYNLAAVDAVSGVLDTQWTPPQVNGYVQTLSVYGSRVYVGGRFLSMGGLPRNNLAAVDVVTGDVDLRWDPNANGDVLTLATSGSRVYVGGLFASMGGKQRNYLAAVDAMTGDVDDSWNPNPISSVNALVVSAQKIFVGGSFWLMGDVPRNRLAAVNAVTGELDTEWNPSRVSSGWGPVLALSLNGPRLSVGDSPGFGWFLDPSRPYAPDAGAISKVSAKGVQAYWDFSSLAESYTLAASLSLVLPPISPLLKTGITSLNDSVAGLTPNTTYYLWVNASNVIGVSDYTFLGSTLTLSAIPENFQASGISSTRAMLSWTANGNPNNTIYTLQESSDGGLNYTTIFTGSSRDVFLTNLTEGTRYLFRVFSQNIAGVSSEPTNMVLWTLVDAPASGQIVETMAGTASAQWEASQGATSYTLSASLRPEIPPTSPLLKTGITALTDSIPGLTPNTTYYFSVSACLETFCSAYTALGSTITLSAIPTDFMVSGISGTGATFSWAANGNPNNTTYILEESPDEGLIYSPVYTGIVPTVSLTNLTAGTRYLFRVLSQNVAGVHSSPTAPVAVISPPSAPARGSITGTTISGTSAQWIESVGATRYTLAASVTPTLPGTFPFNKSGITELTATLSGLAPNTPYSLWVSACNETGCSTYLALGSTVTLPAAPTSFRVKSTTDDTVTLAWNSGGNPAGTIYVIQQSVQGDLDYSEVARVTSTEATIRNLEEQTTYSFRVLVLGVSGGLSVLSSEIGTTTSPKYVDVAQIRYYPNPSHGPMTFDHLPEGVTITIHTMIGQRVRQMTVPASEILEWDGKSDSGESVASGVYLVRATGAGNKTFKIVIQR